VSARGPHGGRAVIEGPIIGVVLAGGQSRRMGGGDKCLAALGGKPLLAHVAKRVSGQVDALILNGNGDPARFAEFALPVVADVIDGFAGPLAGILTGLQWMAEHRPEARWLASFPGDTPFLPTDLVWRMSEAIAAEGADMACARSGGRDHPVIGLWPVAVKDDLSQAMTQEEVRKIDLFTGRYRLARAEYADLPFDPFFNVNRPDDFARAEAVLRGRST